MKAKLASLLGGSKKSKQASQETTTKGAGSVGSKGERSDSDVIDRMADLKVSNPLFIGDSKLTNHSFIRHVKAESQCHPKTPFHGKGQGFFFAQNMASKEPKSKTQNAGSSNTSDGVSSEQEQIPDKIISVRKLSIDDENPSFLRTVSQVVNAKERDSAIPMRVVSQQHKLTHRLFDVLAADNNSSGKQSSSNDNAIDKLNLLEEDEDDESEWLEPPLTVFDPD